MATIQSGPYQKNDEELLIIARWQVKPKTDDQHVSQPLMRANDGVLQWTYEVVRESVTRCHVGSLIPGAFGITLERIMVISQTLR